MMAVRLWICCLCTVFLTSHVYAQVNGGWGPWGDWRPLNCPVTCGGAQSLGSQSRECNNPAPSGGGAACTGDGFMISSGTCGDDPCPVDGAWTEWMQWTDGACSPACGGGTLLRNRTRQCINPAPRFGGAPCPGSDTEIVTAVCNTDPCRVDGSWSPWAQWTDGSCSHTCEGGTLVRNRTRACINPAPSNGGASCPGLDTQTEMLDCNTQSCSVSPVDGNWGSWGQWTTSACSQTCGNGVSIAERMRQCNNPPPSNGGEPCANPASYIESESRVCRVISCPIHGGWSRWTEWSASSCSVTCGAGSLQRSRMRLCNNPSPVDGGYSCVGNNTETSTAVCNRDSCKVSPVDGNWGSWGQWTTSACSQTCGNGVSIAERMRQCNNPPPSNGGEPCANPASYIESESRVCRVISCPIHGGWSRWTEWSASSCSVTCGAGSLQRSRMRLCNNPSPMYGGYNCVGNNTETSTAVCNRDSCNVSPIDGNWGFWSQWSGTLCPVTCGGGRYTRERSRACDSPAPSNGGADCADPTSYVQRENPTCNENPCPINGGFGQWAFWTSACSKSCGPGVLVEMKTRLCNNPAPQNGGGFCEGALIQNVTKECNLGDCSGRFGFTAIIVLDGSESIGDSNFQTIKLALHTVAQEALSQNGLIKIGVVVFSDKITQVISATSDVESLVTDIGNIAYPDGGTSTHLGIEAARQLLLQEHSDGKYIFLLTDGLSNLPEVTRGAADQAKADEITILVLGVTQVVGTFPEYKAQFDKEMNDIASPGFVFTSETFDSILSVTASILQNLFDSALWSMWGPWSDAPCPVTCGTEAVRPSTRTRTCLSGSQPTSDCRGPTSEERYLSCGLSSGCPGRGHYTYVIVGVVCGAVVLLVLVVFVVFIYKIRSSDGIEKSPHSAYTVPDKTSGSYDNHVYSQMDEKPPGLKSVDSQYHEYTQPVEGLTPTDRNNGYIDILDDQSQVVRM